jgi:hypothetical protein
MQKKGICYWNQSSRIALELFCVERALLPAAFDVVVAFAVASNSKLLAKSKPTHCAV